MKRERSKDERTSVSEASVATEIARLRDLDLGALRARWRTVFGRAAPTHLSRHLLYRMLAYRLQADALDDLDADSLATLNKVRMASAGQEGQVVAQQLKQADAKLRPGTILSREWDGHLQRVTVLSEGFTWGGRTFPSLSAVASAIAGSKWNGPRFFGLRQAPDARKRS